MAGDCILSIKDRIRRCLRSAIWCVVYTAHYLELATDFLIRPPSLVKPVAASL